MIDVDGVWWPAFDHKARKANAFVLRHVPDMDYAVSLARGKQCAVQAGGHVGLWPRHLAEHFAHVLTFEPIPQTYACLQRNTAHLPNVITHRQALGSACGAARMQQTPSSGNCFVDDAGNVDVTVTTLDAAIGDMGCDALLLDVEGHEPQALAGARQTIMRCKPVIHIEMLARVHAQIMAFMHDADYQLVGTRGSRSHDGIFIAWPDTLTEEQTLRRAIEGASLARFGDGELRLALGGSAASQKADWKLRCELQRILRGPSQALVCIPNPRTPKPTWGRTFNDANMLGLLGNQAFGSSFITRPDSAPNIDCAGYWDSIRSLWRGHDVTFVRGDDRSLTPAQLHDAKSLEVIDAPSKHAYAQVDRIEARIGASMAALGGSGKPKSRVIMCLGATATVLAHRLAHKGVHALDLGHVGMFMRHCEAYGMDRRKLISKEWRAANAALHASGKGYGGSGHKHVKAIAHHVERLHAASVLDYGCGEGTLKAALLARCPDVRVHEYDPCIEAKAGPFKPADIVVCTDVLEHVEPALLDNVLAHVKASARRGVYLSIALRPSNKTLPDGRNVHAIVEDAQWWMQRLMQAGYCIVDPIIIAHHSMTLWVAINGGDDELDANQSELSGAIRVVR